MQLHRQLGITYNSVSRLQRKLMQVMMEHDHTDKLSGLIEIGDAYLGEGRLVNTGNIIWQSFDIGSISVLI